MQKLLKQIYEKSKPLTKKGHVATYIPELGNVDRDLLGIYVINKENESFKVGDYDKKFSVQSVSKVITLICCMMDCPEDLVAKKVSFEPTAQGFNDIANLELHNLNRPLNPFINAGAIICTSLIKGNSAHEKVDRVIEMIKKLSDNDDIHVNGEVYYSEKMTGSRNKSLAYYMHSTGILEADVEQTLDAYFMICAIEVTCEDLAKMALVITNNGICPTTNQQLIPLSIARKTRAVMALCGMYDGSGDFAVRVGLPSKSGVGGGIMTVTKSGLGIGVFGPSLDARGNSIAGVDALERLSNELNLSIF